MESYRIYSLNERMKIYSNKGKTIQEIVKELIKDCKILNQFRMIDKYIIISVINKILSTSNSDEIDFNCKLNHFQFN